MSFLKVLQALPSRGRCHPGVTDEVSVLHNLINRSMLVKIAKVIESNAVIYAVRLGLGLKTKCSVLYSFYTTSEIWFATEKITRIELHAGLVCVDVKRELSISNACSERKSIMEKSLTNFRAEYKIMVVSVYTLAEIFAYSLRGPEVEGRTLNEGTVAVWNKTFVNLGIAACIDRRNMIVDNSAESVEVKV